jgi:peptidoglycan/LPS O-acetylase OafA/YrhL
VHFVLLAQLAPELADLGGYKVVALALALICIPLSVAGAHLLHVAVERPSRRLRAPSAVGRAGLEGA